MPLPQRRPWAVPMRKIEGHDLIALGFSPEEVAIFATPMQEWGKRGISYPQAMEITDRVQASLRLKEAENYHRENRHRAGFSISDHALADGDNLWHPNAKGFFGSKSKFRAETRARGGEEVGNDYKPQAASDEYDLKPTVKQKEIVRDRLDNVMRGIDQSRGRIVPRRM